MSQPNFEQNEMPDFVVLSEDFFGIEEVLVPTGEDDIIDGGVVEPGDVQEATAFSKEQVIDGGTIETTDSGALSVRKRIVTAVLSLWIVWTLIGLIVFLETGNTILLLSSPAIMSVPLYKVVGYYFR